MTYTPNAAEQTLIAKIVSLENEIERAEGVKARLLNDAALNKMLRQLRRQRAGYLSMLLGEVQGDDWRQLKAA